MRSPLMSVKPMSHVHLHVGGMPIVQLVFACARSGHGAMPFTQSFFCASHVHCAWHESMLSLSQTESPGMHGSDCTQLSVGSQYDCAGQSASLILCRHFPLFASHESSVHATPSLQFAGSPVATQ